MKFTSSIKKINIGERDIKIIILDSRVDKTKKAPCIMWIHGGGYSLGMPEMVYASRVRDLLADNELIVVSPKYRLATSEPYPAALEDCYGVLLYLKNHAEEFFIDTDKIMLGGESAGGGLCLATGIYARDKGEVSIKYMFPLYPMIDSSDTESSKDNHAYVWNTRRNHWAWKKYLGDLYESDDISYYAAPAKLKDFRNLPPFYTFVCDGEPFYSEIVDFTNKAKEAGVDARCDVYHANTHAFDMYCIFSEERVKARENFVKNYEYVKNKYLK